MTEFSEYTEVEVLPDNSSTREDSQRRLQGDYVPPWKRSTKVAPKVTLGWRDELEGVIRPWHAALHSKKVNTARAEFAKACDAAGVAADSELALGADELAEKRAIEAQAVVDAREGKVTDVKSTDFGYERARREAIWSSLHGIAQAAQQAYLQTVAAEAPDRIVDLVDSAAEAREAALDAMESVGELVREAVAATRAIRAADRDLHLQPKSWHRTTPEREALPTGAIRGVADIEAFLRSDDALAVTGEYVLSTSTTIPDHTRRALAASDRVEDKWSLYQTEASEDFKISAHAKNLEFSYPVEPSFVTEYLDRRELPH